MITLLVSNRYRQESATQIEIQAQASYLLFSLYIYSSEIHILIDALCYEQVNYCVLSVYTKIIENARCIFH